MNDHREVAWRCQAATFFSARAASGLAIHLSVRDTKKTKGNNLIMTMNDTNRAKEIISKIIYITIASVSKEGQPWNTPVYSAFDEQYNFFWASWKEDEHSKNIRDNSQVFIVIYDSTVPEGTGRGVYVKAKAFELSDSREIKHALNYLYKRKNKTSRKVEEFLGEHPRRVYKAVPEKFWINQDSEVNGNFVDTRVEVRIL